MGPNSAYMSQLYPSQQALQQRAAETLIPQGPFYNPSAMPAPGTATNGLQTTGFAPQQGATNGLSTSPNWAAIIAHALRK